MLNIITNKVDPKIIILFFFVKELKAEVIKDFSVSLRPISLSLENRLIKELFIKIEYKIEEDTEVNYDDKGFYNRSLIVSLLQKFK